jgi:pimeloyl-ACP methyl ester carboxylesterase
VVGLRARLVCGAVLVLVLSGCSAATSSAPEPAPSASPTPTDTDRNGVVEFDGLTVAFHCAGEGGPTVILEAGGDSQGTTSFTPALFVPIADVTTVCTYNRLGTGGVTSSAPDEARTFADVVDVLDGVISALELEEPFVVAGQSSGGNAAIAYAAIHPDRVAALVPIEAYHDDPAEMAAWQEEEGFTWEDSPEHMDLVPSVVEQDSIQMPIGEFPVLVISASDADPGGPENQAHWLGLSPNSRQVVMEGPHDLQETAPEELAAAIIAVVSDLQKG